MRFRFASQGSERVEKQDDDDQADGNPDDGTRADPDSFLVLRIEVPHKACGGLEARVVLLCHNGRLFAVYIKTFLEVDLLPYFRLNLYPNKDETETIFNNALMGP